VRREAPAVVRRGLGSCWWAIVEELGTAVAPSAYGVSGSAKRRHPAARDLELDAGLSNRQVALP